jgi:glutathione S-transferase
MQLYDVVMLSGPGASLPQLFQTEWCPASRRVRQRLTELEIDVVARQVPADREDRDVLRSATGDDAVPVLVTEWGEVVAGEGAILAFLAERYAEPPGAAAHRRRAERARRRELEEAARCLEPSMR